MLGPHPSDPGSSPDGGMFGTRAIDLGQFRVAKPTTTNNKNNNNNNNKGRCPIRDPGCFVFTTCVFYNGFCRATTEKQFLLQKN
jgi:hypothetical protein